MHECNAIAKRKDFINNINNRNSKSTTVMCIKNMCDEHFKQSKRVVCIHKSKTDNRPKKISVLSTSTPLSVPFPHPPHLSHDVQLPNCTNRKHCRHNYRPFPRPPKSLDLCHPPFVVSAKHQNQHTSMCNVESVSTFLE